MSSPLHLRSRFRSLLSRAKGKLRREANTLAYAHLPLKEKTIQLAQEQCLSHAAQAFQVFGHTTLRGILSKEEIKKISTGLDEIGAGLSCQDSVITVAPVEKSRKLQDVVFNSELLYVLKSLLPPFWYFGSDACVGVPIFSKHRDTFYTPPLLQDFHPACSLHFRSVARIPFPRRFLFARSQPLCKRLGFRDSGPISGWRSAF